MFVLKIKLSPELAYIIGFWRKRRTFEGLGIRADEDRLGIFSKEILDKGLTTPEKFISQDDRVFFYHSAYRKFFQDVVEEQLERFCYINDYSASYLAGLFDSVGQIEDSGVISLEKANREDEVLLLRLGFNSMRKNGKLIIERPVVFLKFIKNYVKLFKNHKIFDYVEKKAK